MNTLNHEVKTVLCAEISWLEDACRSAALVFAMPRIIELPSTAVDQHACSSAKPSTKKAKGKYPQAFSVLDSVSASNGPTIAPKLDDLIYNAFETCRDIVRARADTELDAESRQREIQNYEQELKGYRLSISRAVQNDKLPDECAEHLKQAIALAQQEPVHEKWQKMLQFRQAATARQKQDRPFI